MSMLHTAETTFNKLTNPDTLTHNIPSHVVDVWQRKPCLEQKC